MVARLSILALVFLAGCAHATLPYAPDPQPSLSGCLGEGLMYAAQSRLVTPGTYPKVVCIPRRMREAKTIGEH